MKKIKKEYMLTIIAGIILVFLGIFVQITEIAKGVIPLIFMNSGTILIVISVIAHNRYGAGVHQDERTRKLGAKALSYSWLLSFVLVNILYWVDFTKILTLSVSQVLGILLFTMTLSAGVIQMLLKKRGVVDED